MAGRNEPAGSRRPDDDHDDMNPAQATEHTPLLPRDQNEAIDQSQPHRETSAQESLELLQNSPRKSKRRWPSIVALLALCIAVILIIVFVFIAPPTVEQYAQEALVFEPSSLSIDSFTRTGVRARIQGDFMMDASRVKSKPVRDIGRFCTWIAGSAESGETDVEVSLPEYGNVLLGSAHMPGIKVSIRDGQSTHLDVLSDLQPGDKDGIRRIANDWIDGRLGQIRLLGKASVPVKSGIISLGNQLVQHEVLFSNDNIPSIPSYDIKKLLFHDVEGKGLAADVSLVVQNDYPVDFTTPPMSFSILVENCKKSDPYIKLADATTDEIHITPRSQVVVNVTGLVHELPDMLVQDCPGTDTSPLDHFLRHYMHGKKNTIYVQGSDASSDKTPRWISDLIRDLTVPIPLPGRAPGKLIKNFTLADTHFSLPDPWADPNKPEAQPRISAKVKATVALPDEMNLDVSVSKVRADADVFYKGKKFGWLDLNKWQPANSTRPEVPEKEQPLLIIESLVDDAPLYITDENAFTDVVQDLVFKGKKVIMDIKADVDVQVETALGEFAIRKIPAAGQVPVNPSPSTIGKPGKNLTSILNPKLGDLRILETTRSSLVLSALINFTNPTPYSASIPYLDVQLVKNGSILGHATIQNLNITTGNNTNLNISAAYDPLSLGGTPGRAIGRELISQYVSGFNTTITVQTHNGTIPNHPSLGHALSRLAISIPIPQIHAPSPPSDPNDGGGDGEEDDAPHFIRDATMHLFSSTATFTLFSPLRHSTLVLTSINATAIYRDDDGEDYDIGRILYTEPFDVPPVDKHGTGVETPRLPVDWDLGSVGYEAVRKALGGRLKVGAFAWIGVKVGHFRETVWFRGKGIGARVRF